MKIVKLVDVEIKSHLPNKLLSIIFCIILTFYVQT